MSRLHSAKMNKAWQANVAALGDRLDADKIRELRVHTLASMAAALECEKAAYWFQGARPDRKEDHLHTQRHAMNPDPDALALAMAQSDALLDAALALDPRLAKRAQWTRGEDGIFADAGLVASGDDSPCLNMERKRLVEFAAAGDPVNVVISTDSSQPTSLPAFIAAVRIVQQFRPVNVWWQGSWLNDSGADYGYVFFSPLVSNDMDFRRVQFVITDPARDHLSFGVLQTHAVKDKVKVIGIGRHATQSYMEGAHFVGKEGIAPDPERIAAIACRWLGWPSTWRLECTAEDDSTAALQEIPQPRAPYVSKPETAAQRAEWKRQADEDDRRKQAEAAARLAAH